MKRVKMWLNLRQRIPLDIQDILTIWNEWQVKQMQIASEYNKKWFEKWNSSVIKTSAKPNPASMIIE